MCVFMCVAVRMAASLGFPFTSAQWRELERQAMIYKYMMASAPIPPELLIPTCRNTSDPAASHSHCNYPCSLLWFFLYFFFFFILCLFSRWTAPFLTDLMWSSLSLSSPTRQARTHTNTHHHIQYLFSFPLLGLLYLSFVDGLFNLIAV